MRSVVYAGDVKSIDLWFDIWCGEAALQSLFPNMYESAVQKNLKISKCLTRDGWRVIGFKIEQRSVGVIWRYNTDEERVGENIVCVLCGVKAQTMNHLFTQYVISRFVIAMAVEWVRSRDLGDNVRSVWDKWNNAPSSRTRLTEREREGVEEKEEEDEDEEEGDEALIAAAAAEAEAEAEAGHGELLLGPVIVVVPKDPRARCLSSLSLSFSDAAAADDDDDDPPPPLSVLPASLSSAADPLLLRRRYRLGAELGRGEFGVTRRCADADAGEALACKSISKRRLRAAADVEDVRREVDIMRCRLPRTPTSSASATPSRTARPSTSSWSSARAASSSTASSPAATSPSAPPPPSCAPLSRS
uniref:Protein kinase domain-containing protein n=1 Tax=Ananas comosus var. bracteatus TaxID=296719 RepID=A0A6V7NMV6_ANACO|nr:unnamed protein product [Ananas comosus var. bracteatus]